MCLAGWLIGRALLGALNHASALKSMAAPQRSAGPLAKFGPQHSHA